MLIIKISLVTTVGDLWSGLFYRFISVFFQFELLKHFPGPLSNDSCDNVTYRFKKFAHVLMLQIKRISIMGFFFLHLKIIKQIFSDFVAGVSLLCHDAVVDVELDTLPVSLFKH